MAEKKLQSLKFYGLDDTYKIPTNPEDVGAAPKAHRHTIGDLSGVFPCSGDRMYAKTNWLTEPGVQFDLVKKEWPSIKEGVSIMEFIDPRGIFHAAIIQKIGTQYGSATMFGYSGGVVYKLLGGVWSETMWYN